MKPINFDSPLYNNDPRFTANLDQNKEDPGFYDDIQAKQQSIRENGRIFFGHSSPALVEAALALPKGTLEKTYTWPKPFTAMSHAQRDIAIDRLTFAAYPYICTEHHRTVEKLGLPKELLIEKLPLSPEQIASSKKSFDQL